MKAIAVLVAFLFLLIFPGTSFAAISITNISPTIVNSADGLISITASASGLSSSTQYLQALFTKDGDATNYFGLTQNLSGEWYRYKSSPSLTSDLQVYFYSFVPVSGAWNGTISAKLDIDDAGFKGPGNYVVKLAKYITTGTPTYSSNTSLLTANITPTPTQTPTATSTTVPTSSSTTTPTLTKTPTPIPVTVTMASSSSNILGESTGSATFSGETISPTLKQSAVVEKKTQVLAENNFAKVAVTGGIIFISACGILAFRAYRKRKNDIKNQR